MPAYLGYENGKLILYYAQSEIEKGENITKANPTPNPFGTRLQKGTKFPSAVYDLYDENIPTTPEIALQALKSANAYLNGEEAGSEKLTFGESTVKTKRKKTT